MASTLARALGRTGLTRTRRDLVWFFSAVVYFIVLGGTGAGEQLAALRGLNLLLAGILIVLWIRRADEYDALDLAVICGVVLYAAAALLSSSMRLSLDPAIQGLGYAALFWYARRLLANPAAYSALIWIFGGLCIAITVLVAISWAGVWLEWARLTDFREVPPLSLLLPTGPYLHRHDLVLLIAMLAPALLVPIGFGRALGVRVVIGVLLLALLLMDGSRTAMVSIAAGVVTGGALALHRSPQLRTRIRLGRRGRIAVAGAAVAGAFGVVVAAEPLVGRLLEFGTLSGRGILWSTAASAWLADPLSGSGPGTYLISLFDVGYYDANTYFPRNTDGAPFMVLAETGALGFVALAIVLAGLVRSRMAPSRPVALFIAPVAMFVVAGIGSVPADFGYLVAPALVWLAAAYPPLPSAARAIRLGNAWSAGIVRGAAMTAVVVIGIAVGATIAAGNAYEAARVAISRHDLDGATARLRDAIWLDPGFALYSRALGAVELARGEPERAIAALEQSREAEPRDPVISRLETFAHLAAGDIGRARDASDRALELQGSQTLHRIAAAIVASAAGDRAAAEDEIDRFLATAPLLMGAEEWPTALGERRTAADAMFLLELWARSPDRAAAPVPGMVLAALAQDDAQGAVEAVTAGFASSRDALRALFACDTEAASAALAAAGVTERTLPTYWAVGVMVGRVRGQDVETELGLGRITGLGRGGSDAFASSLLGEIWIYRRVPLPAIALPFDLPDGDFAFTRWLSDPKAAAASAGAQALAECQPAG